METTFSEPTLRLSERKIEERLIPEILGTPARTMHRGNDEQGEQEEEAQPDMVRSVAVIVNVPSEENKMQFSIEYDMYVKEKKVFKNNMIKAYATIFDYYSMIMQ